MYANRSLRARIGDSKKLVLLPAPVKQADSEEKVDDEDAVPINEETAAMNKVP